MNKIIVYTAIYNGKDDLIIPKLKGCDFVYFTGDGGLMDAKKPKILPHRYFKEYDYSMWIDGNISIFGDIKVLIEGYMKKYDIVMLAHPQSSFSLDGVSHLFSVRSLYKEFKACIEQKFAALAILKKQRGFYEKEGCPEGIEVVASGIIIRKHNKKNIIKFDERWWKEICKYSHRDQLSFAYLSWKMNLRYGKLNNVGLEAKWFKYCEHKI